MKSKLFDKIDFPLIRDAKNCDVIVKLVNDKILRLEIDGKEVRVEKTKDGIVMKCPCDWCGRKGVARKTPCRRIIRAWWFLIQRNGRINEIEVEYAKDKINT